MLEPQSSDTVIDSQSSVVESGVGDIVIPQEVVVVQSQTPPLQPVSPVDVVEAPLNLPAVPAEVVQTDSVFPNGG